MMRADENMVILYMAKAIIVKMFSTLIREMPSNRRKRRCMPANYSSSLSTESNALASMNIYCKSQANKAKTSKQNVISLSFLIVLVQISHYTKIITESEAKSINTCCSSNQLGRVYRSSNNKFRIIDASDYLADRSKYAVGQQNLALQIVTNDTKPNNYATIDKNEAEKARELEDAALLYTNNHNSNKKLKSKLRNSLAYKRPYDVQVSDVHNDGYKFNQDSDILNKTSSIREEAKNQSDRWTFYIAEPGDTVKSDGPLNETHSEPSDVNSTSSTRKPLATSPADDLSPRLQLTNRRRSELIRTQHRPPWSLLKNVQQNYTAKFEHLGKKFRLKLTTIAPSALTTQEIFKLISSAHSPVKIGINMIPTIRRNKTASAQKHEGLEEKSAPIDGGHSTHLVPSFAEMGRKSLVGQYKGKERPSAQRIDEAEASEMSSAETGTLASDTKNTSILDRGVLSPAILVNDDEETNEDYSGKNDIGDRDYGNLNGKRHLFNYTVKTQNRPDGRPVTIIRNSKIRVVARPTTQAPNFIVIPNKIKIETTLAPPITAITNTTLVRMIAKQKHKYDDSITSAPLTVIDNDAFRVPQNATVIHNNRLLVRIRPGQQQTQRFQVTTEYPYYNPVAGITPPYPTNPRTTTPRPTPKVSNVIHSPNQSTTASPSSKFGSQKIRFPATPPLADGLESSQQQLPPSRLNISVPSDANLVGPNRVPEKITMETEEQVPSSSLVVSDSTIVGRPPHGSSTINQDGIVRLSTTRRPNRQTTKRINIVSANTTIVTTSPDQLQEVLSSVISSHQNDIHHVNQNRPSHKPDFLQSIANFFNGSVATTFLAIVTAIKTVLVAVLIMFLPPIALTAAIVQAISLG